MISFDFAYYRPSSVGEAVSTYYNIKSSGKKPIYYGGGTEIISSARVNMQKFDAVIDIKDIPECRALQIQKGNLIVGAAVTLTNICETNLFPLLTKASRAAADHTSRNKITIGGNICGAIPYREALLPFLLCDCQVVVAGLGGTRMMPLSKVYNKQLQLEEGELLVQVITETCFLNMPHEYVKRTKMGEVDYPLVTMAALKKDNTVRIAFSGICGFPFRCMKMEEDLNDMNAAPDERINKAMGHLPAPLVNDLQGSSGYRDFVMRNMLLDVLEKMGDAF